MKSTILTALFVLAVSFTIPAYAQTGTGTAQSRVAQAFEPYELVRAALAADNLSEATSHARTLAERAEAAGGIEAKNAAARLADAKNIEEARKSFGEVSTILLPIFQAEAIPGTTAYMCSMKQKPWVQRGDKVANPYYGKSMLTCGTALPAKTK